jgi:hypothetical protein
VPFLRFRYGAHLSAEQVAELVRPNPDTLELISAWLKYYSIRSSSISTTHGGGWLTVTEVLMSQADQLLGASYQLYRNTKTNDTTTIRTVGYALPAVLHTHIRAVAPTTYFTSTRVTRQTTRRRSMGAARAQAQAASGKLVTALSSRAIEIGPAFLRWLLIWRSVRSGSSSDRSSEPNFPVPHWRRGGTAAGRYWVDSGSAGPPSRWARDGLEVLYYPELDHAMVFDARADRAALLEVLFGSCARTGPQAQVR